MLYIFYTFNSNKVMATSLCGQWHRAVYLCVGVCCLYSNQHKHVKINTACNRDQHAHAFFPPLFHVLSLSYQQVHGPSNYDCVANLCPDKSPLSIRDAQQEFTDDCEIWWEIFRDRNFAAFTRYDRCTFPALGSRFAIAFGSSFCRWSTMIRLPLVDRPVNCVHSVCSVSV